MPVRATMLPFSPHYAFHAARPLVLNGEHFAVGQALPRGALDERRLRQLYEQRKITPHAPDFLFNGAAASREAVERAQAEAELGGLPPVENELDAAPAATTEGESDAPKRKRKTA